MAPWRDGGTEKATEAGMLGMRASRGPGRDGLSGTEPCGQGKVLDFIPSQLGSLPIF